MLHLILAVSLQVSASRAVLVQDLDRLNHAYWRCGSDCSAIRAQMSNTGDRLVYEGLGYLHNDRREFERLTQAQWRQPEGAFRIPTGVLRLIPMWRHK